MSRSGGVWYESHPGDPENYFWRVGRRVGRTIYALVEGRERPSDFDPLIGVMDTPQLAREAVEAHNGRLGRGA